MIMLISGSGSPSTLQNLQFETPLFDGDGLLMLPLLPPPLYVTITIPLPFLVLAEPVPSLVINNLLHLSKTTSTGRKPLGHLAPLPLLS